jgi:hypothetical protein
MLERHRELRLAREALAEALVERRAPGVISFSATLRFSRRSNARYTTPMPAVPDQLLEPVAEKIESLRSGVSADKGLVRLRPNDIRARRHANAVCT